MVFRRRVTAPGWRAHFHLAASVGFLWRSGGINTHPLTDGQAVAFRARLPFPIIFAFSAFRLTGLGAGAGHFWSVGPASFPTASTVQPDPADRSGGHIQLVGRGHLSGPPERDPALVQDPTRRRAGAERQP